jgi:hypothetical protein
LLSLATIFFYVYYSKKRTNSLVFVFEKTKHLEHTINNNQQATMSGDATRKAPTLSWATEVELGIKKLALDDERQIEIIMGYLRDKAPLACYDTKNHKEQTCHCLSWLENNKTSLNAVALYILWFSQLPKHTQQLILMEKI